MTVDWCDTTLAVSFAFDKASSGSRCRPTLTRGHRSSRRSRPTPCVEARRVRRLGTLEATPMRLISAPNNSRIETKRGSPANGSSGATAPARRRYARQQRQALRPRGRPRGVQARDVASTSRAPRLATPTKPAHQPEPGPPGIDFTGGNWPGTRRSSARSRPPPALPSPSSRPR
jgi:hypothetical protein